MPGTMAIVALVMMVCFGSGQELPVSISAEPFSHEEWTAVLGKFVDDEGLVNYVGLSGNSDGFSRYVQAVGKISPAVAPELFPTEEERLAYYLNAYNALVFEGVLRRGPEEESVWSGLVSGLKFFGMMKVKVGGEKMSLKTLEDQYIREQFQDPRIHAALNCASIGCPRLRRTAFESGTLHEDLDSAMQEFVSAELHVEIDRDRKTVLLSKIFDWFEDDFLDDEKRRGISDPNILDAINRYRSVDEQIPRGYKVDFRPYDKRINKQ
jgi:hypothetical protein